MSNLHNTIEYINSLSQSDPKAVSYTHLLERIMVRDGIKKEAALRRIRAQKDESFYKNHSDIIIKNYPPYNLDDEVKKVLLWAKL